MKPWVRMENIGGGVLVYCSLCGRKRTRRTFMAANTNYAEARRAATAYHWELEHSEAHQVALAVFHAPEVPEITDEDRILREVFNSPIPTDRERRLQAARDAAARVAR